MRKELESATDPLARQMLFDIKHKDSEHLFPSTDFRRGYEVTWGIRTDILKIKNGLRLKDILKIYPLLQKKDYVRPSNLLQHKLAIGKIQMLYIVSDGHRGPEISRL